MSREAFARHTEITPVACIINSQQALHTAT